MKGNKMKLLQKLLLSAVVTLSLTGPCNSMGVGPADAVAAGPDFFAILPDKFLVQIIEIILTQAAKDDPTLCQFGNTFNHLRNTCRRFRAMLNNSARSDDLLVRALRNASINPNEALLKIAIHGKHAWLIPLLVKAGANVNATEYTPLNSAVLSDHLPVVQELIRAGANVNIQDADGDTPLHCAASKCLLPIAQELIRAGANVNAQNNDGETPLCITYIHAHKAAQQSTGEALRAAGAHC